MSITRDVTKVIKDPRKVFLVIQGAEQELGYTSGGIEFTAALESYDVESDQIGFLDRLIKTRQLRVVTPLLQYDIELLHRVIPGSVLTIDGPKKKLEIGTCTGQSLRSLALPMILRPEGKAGTDKTEDIKLYLVAPEGDQVLTWNNEASKETTKVNWVAFPDTTKTATKNLAVIGDESATE